MKLMAVFVLMLMVARFLEGSTIKQDDKWGNVTTSEETTMDNFVNITSADFVVRQKKNDAERYLYIGQHIFLYCAPPMAVIGILGNLASFLVLISRQMSGNSFYVYTSFLAVADTQALLYFIVTMWYARLLAPPPFYLQNDALYKVHLIWKKFSSVLPAWVLVAVSVERFLITWFPFKGPRFCTPKCARGVLLVITALVSAYSVGTVAQFGIGLGPARFEAFGLTSGASFMLLPVLYSYAPLSLITLFSTLTAVRLLRSGLKDPLGSSKMLSSSVMKARKATKVVLIVAVAYIVLTLPVTIFIPMSNTTPRPHPLYFPIVYYIVYLGFIANHSFNFLLYVLVSDKLRQAFLSLIGIKRKSGRSLEPKRNTDQSSSTGQITVLTESAIKQNPVGSEFEVGRNPIESELAVAQSQEASEYDLN